MSVIIGGLPAGAGNAARVGAEIDLRQIAAEARADLPGQVVVAIDERSLREHTVDALRVGRLRARGRCRGR
jgi:hypothetical protein